jgi:hypothetical protein
MADEDRVRARLDHLLHTARQRHLRPGQGGKIALQHQHAARPAQPVDAQPRRGECPRHAVLTTGQHIDAKAPVLHQHIMHARLAVDADQQGCRIIADRTDRRGGHAVASGGAGGGDDIHRRGQRRHAWRKSSRETMIASISA